MRLEDILIVEQILPKDIMKIKFNGSEYYYSRQFY